MQYGYGCNSKLNVSKKIIFWAIAVFLITACQKNESEPTRSYYMGFSPWMYDNTLEAQSWTYSTITTNGDIVSEHMEEGVPWQEAFDNTSFPQSFVEEIETRIQLLGENHKVVLQINPLNGFRNGLANYRGDSPNQPLPPEWSGLALNDTKVKTAFLNYAKRMVEYFSPNYLLIGVESNLLIRNNPSVWPQYLELHQFIYTELKKVYPSLPISVSVFCVSFFPQWSNEDNLEPQMEGLRAIEPFADFISFSIHPFISGLLAESFPSDYLSTLFSLTSKPIAISESSYPAQTWQTSEEPILIFNGSEEKQNNFLELLLEKSNKANVKFVIWFSVRDFDALWNNALNRDPNALPWRDTGLFDEEGNERVAMGAWSKWFDKPIK